MLSLVRYIGLLLSPILALRAQDTVAVSPGARARVFIMPSGLAREGVLDRIAKDTLFLRTCRRCEAESVPREAVQHVDVSIGRPDYQARGMGIGLLAGAAVGAALIGGQCNNTGVGEKLWVGCRTDWIVGGLIGGFAGVFVGGAIGTWWPREQWRPARVAWPTS
ncbi:MAG: hypothetical protein M3037_03550 [Gemmatimonadota bacterium]|nr:hypothetical protein [Gemmatimonadota bacterium]